MGRRTALGGIVRAILCSGIVVTASVEADWPQWHGPNRDNKSSETGLSASWPEGGPAKLWSVEGLGTGWSTVAVADGTIYTTGMDRRRQGWLFAFDLNGKPRWRQTYGPDWGRSVPGARCTPTVLDGAVYVISGVGQVACFDAATGQPRWRVDPFTEFGGRYGSWGIAESPLIVDDKVIFTVGGTKAVMVALDRHNGRVVWSTPGTGDRSAYCSPIVVDRGGRKVIVTMVSKAVIGVDAADGRLLWRDPYTDYQPTTKDIKPVSPVAFDGSVYATGGYDTGGTLIELSADGSGFTRKWADTTLDNHHGGVILVDGYIYGANWKGNGNGDWVCLDWKTGKVMYEEHWQCKGSMTYADGMLYCYEEKRGNLALVRPTPEGFQIVSSFRITEGNGQHWAHPVVCDGVLYVRHGDALMAFDVRAR